MEKFKDLFESSTIIYLYKSTNMSSLCRELNEKENNVIIEALKSHKRSDYELMDFLYSIEDTSEKYSDTIVIRYKNMIFSLYASYGKLRIGADGNLTSCKLVKEININDLAKTLKDARIK